MSNDSSRPFSLDTIARIAAHVNTPAHRERFPNPAEAPVNDDFDDFFSNHMTDETMDEMDAR